VATTPEIHPSAIVDPGAELGPRVRVGAFSVIGRDVFIEADAEIGTTGLQGPSSSARARIGHGSILNSVPQDQVQARTRSGVTSGPTPPSASTSPSPATQENG
jgi:UDP-N-acetylglucosamine acyltransferase